MLDYNDDDDGCDECGALRQDWCMCGCPSCGTPPGMRCRHSEPEPPSGRLARGQDLYEELVLNHTETRNQKETATMQERIKHPCSKCDKPPGQLCNACACERYEIAQTLPPSLKVASLPRPFIERFIERDDAWRCDTCGAPPDDETPYLLQDLFGDAPLRVLCGDCKNAEEAEEAEEEREREERARKREEEQRKREEEQRKHAEEEREQRRRRTDPRVRELLDAPEPTSPLPGILDVEPSLHLLYGAPKVGKTTLALLLALAWSNGIEPWPGAPALRGDSRAFILTAEQTPRRVAGLLQRLATSLDLPDGWQDRVTVRSAHSWLEPHPYLDDDGRAFLFDRLAGAQASKIGPFGLVVLDSASRLLPPGLDESSSSDVTPFLEPLQRLAEKHECVVLLIHHEGKTSYSDPRAAPRGSNAFVAVPQAILRLRRYPRHPDLRRLSVFGNSIETTEHLFRVSDSGYGDRIDYFRPEALDIGDHAFLTALERALPLDASPQYVSPIAAAIQRERNPNKKPSGRLRTQVRQTLERLEALSVARRVEKRWVRTGSFI